MVQRGGSFPSPGSKQIEIMPYISTEHVANIRKELKNEFPEIKFSIRRENYSSVNVHIMESPYKFSKNYEQINHFYTENHENQELLKKITGIVIRDQKEVVYDSDYGSVPNYYLNLQVGKWDKPHKTVK